LLKPSSHAFWHPLSSSVLSHPNRIELQINPPRLQQATKPSADQASVRYHLCDCHGSLLLSHPMLTHNPRFVLPIRGCYTLACLLHSTLPSLASSNTNSASLRIGLRCFSRSRCRAPASIRISGKDFPLPFCMDSNQPFLISFFSYVFQHLFSPLYTPDSISRRLHCPFDFGPLASVIFRLPQRLRHPGTLKSRLLVGNMDRKKLSTSLRRLRCVSLSLCVLSAVAMRGSDSFSDRFGADDVK